MTTTFENSNISNNESSKKLNDIIINKNSNIYSNNEFYNNKNNNTMTDFLKNKNILSKEDNTLNMEEANKNNNHSECIESEENKNNNLSSLIKELNFNNLNEYYEIQSSIFMKKIQKLNLKFYYTTEVFLNDKIIQYPYNKLFLILFKEISLYIEEILRLNKQLSCKNKNEKYYTQKINEYKTKEKEYLSSKQITKNLQKNIKTLEKNNEKLKNEIIKLNKKINNTNAPSLSPNVNSKSGIWRNTVSGNKQSYNDYKKTSNQLYMGHLTEQGSVMSSGSNILSNRTYFNNKCKNKSKDVNNKNKTNRIHSNSSINSKATNVSSANNNNKDIIFLGINQCEEEINNLNMIENLLMKTYDNNYNKKIVFKGNIKKNYNIFSPEKSTRSQGIYTTYKKSFNNYRKKQSSNKSMDPKISFNIKNTNKI